MARPSPTREESIPKEQKMKMTLAITVTLAVALLGAGGIRAETVKHPSELTYPPLELKMPDYEELEFDNGMSGFLIEDHEVPVVNIFMLIGTGRAPREKMGLDDLTAWAIRNGGSKNWSAERINSELEFVAAGVEFGRRSGGGMGGPGFSAAGRGVTVTVNCLKKDLGLCLDVLSDLLVSPVFPEDKIELRRETMLENIRRENDSPRSVAFREFDSLLYGDHPMGWRETENTVTSISRDDIVAFHETFYRPNNTVIGISGDVTRDEVVALLDEALVSWEPNDAMVEPEPPLELTFTPSVNYAYKDIDQGVILIGHLGMNSNDENRPAVRIMNFILGGGSFTSRITQKVRTDEGLAYAANSRFSASPWTYGTFVASSQTRSDATARAASLIVELIEDMQAEGPTAEEFELAKDAYLNRHVFDYDSKAAVVGRLVELKWQGRPLDTPERDIEAIENLTIEDVRAAAASYLHPDGLTMLFVGDKDKFEQPLSNFGDVNVIDLE
jgi:zinc protease